MGTRRVDVEPDIPILAGEYHPTQSIPVTMADPVRIQELPCPDGSMISRNIGNIAVHMIKADLRRRWLTLLSHDDDMIVGFTQNEVDSGTAALWPKLVPLVVRLNRDLWVRAATTQTTVTAISEQWTV
jgi:hypothetical protein